MNKQTVLLMITIGLLVVIAILIGLKPKPLPFNEDILYVTTPVHRVKGTVEAVNNAVITLTVPYTTTDREGEKSKKVTYSVTTTDKTVITRQVSPLSGSPFEVQSPQESTPTFGNIAKGQTILVNTPTDLRLLKQNTFEANAIALAEKQYYIRGTITSVSGSSLTIEEIVTKITPSESAQDVQPANKIYTVNMTDRTVFEQALFPRVQGKTTKSIEKTEVNVGDTVAVLTSSDVNTVTTFDALRIQKAPIMPTMPVPQPTR